MQLVNNARQLKIKNRPNICDNLVLFTYIYLLNKQNYLEIDQPTNKSGFSQGQMVVINGDDTRDALIEKYLKIKMTGETRRAF